MVNNTIKNPSKIFFLLITLSLSSQFLPTRTETPCNIDDNCIPFIKIIRDQRDNSYDEDLIKEMIVFIEHNFINFMNYVTIHQKTQILSMLSENLSFRVKLQALYKKYKNRLTDTQKEAINWVLSLNRPKNITETVQ